MPAEELPTPGLGTMRITDPDDGPDVITQAIDIGYRHIDTAQKYDNEGVVGDGIAQADVSRDDLFVATKIAESNLAYDDVLRTADESMELLGLDTVDLLYIHWPAVSSHEDRYDPADTIPAFNELYDEGFMRHVGVANFSVDLIEEAQDRFDAPIFANQVEMHPRLHQGELLAYAQDNDIYLVAYCPLMQGGVGEVPELVDIAEKHEATPAQVSLAWLMSKDNVVPIPMSSGAHLRENFDAQGLELDAEDLDRIDAIEEEERCVDPVKGPWHW
ncbi:MAG: aldo/keto reductase [Halobacteriota archaeon]